jgi:hypothetical protein
MKKGFRICCLALVCFVLAISLIGCGASDPKSLAKEAVDLTKKMLSADVSNAAKLAADYAKLEEKVEKLSEADQEIFYEEVSKLSLELLN